MSDADEMAGILRDMRPALERLGYDYAHHMVGRAAGLIEALEREKAAALGLVDGQATIIRTLEAERDKLREATLDVLASLVAAVSLLERGGRKAAPSNKMSDVMLADYRASIDRARAALAEPSDG